MPADEGVFFVVCVINFYCFRIRWLGCITLWGHSYIYEFVTSAISVFVRLIWNYSEGYWLFSDRIDRKISLKQLGLKGETLRFLVVDTCWAFMFFRIAGECSAWLTEPNIAG